MSFYSPSRFSDITNHKGIYKFWEGVDLNDGLTRVPTSAHFSKIMGTTITATGNIRDINMDKIQLNKELHFTEDGSTWGLIILSGFQGRHQDKRISLDLHLSDALHRSGKQGSLASPSFRRVSIMNERQPSSTRKQPLAFTVE
ncbi:hypothetical protein OsI_25507 [Oryza sativa Indica Group]|uniref:Uncharacterized protein n=1 Tax=Oryza sativa subsp. indica TaxID=39946 RepID=B8B4R3_ORYSI|nr:hypothetical protein OsI_25507 [Oryza sativa Indica Group]